MGSDLFQFAAIEEGIFAQPREFTLQQRALQRGVGS
jgi:hypothetical protein